jgi:hypothetical protein
MRTLSRAFWTVSSSQQPRSAPDQTARLQITSACNIGMTPVINPNFEALTRSRLVHVDQY